MDVGVELCVFLVIIKCVQIDSRLLIIPEDVPAGFAAIYGFAPPITKGNDHRIGFGLRLGNHADFQILYELGPQSYTRPLQTTKARSASIRQRKVRRRPLVDLLVRAGIFKKSCEPNAIGKCNNPR